MGATSSRRTDIVSSSPATLTAPSQPFSSCTTPSRTSSGVSPTCTPHSSRSPSIRIPRHVKGKTSSPLSQFSSRVKRLMYRDSSHYQHTHAWDENENENENENETETNIIPIMNHEYPESSQYRQFQSTSTPTSRLEISSPRLRGMESADHHHMHSPLGLSQPVTIVPITSRTIHIQPNRPRMTTYFSRHATEQSVCTWLSLEWILASRSATHGLFDAYPYHVFDAFLLRTHPTFRPCLSFLHAEQSFRDKWSGWTPCHTNGSNAWKISIMVSDAKTLYQTYFIPIMAFLSPHVISTLQNIGLNSTSIDSTQDADVTLFVHGGMFLPAVHEVMHALRTGPFQSFIETRQYQELGGPTH